MFLVSDVTSAFSTFQSQGAFSCCGTLMRATSPKQPRIIQKCCLTAKACESRSFDTFGVHTFVI